MPRPTRLVIIGGCGHVGLPLGIVFANCGINVVLLDLSAERIATVNSGRTPFMENDAEEHLRAVVGKTLLATSDSSCLKTADAAARLRWYRSPTTRLTWARENTKTGSGMN
ncbi:MAG: hypothetical protein ACHQLQ_05930 [Candidatus Acidiferrales bacterium]